MLPRTKRARPRSEPAPDAGSREPVVTSCLHTAGDGAADGAGVAGAAPRSRRRLHLQHCLRQRRRRSRAARRPCGRGTIAGNSLIPTALRCICCHVPGGASYLSSGPVCSFGACGSHAVCRGDDCDDDLLAPGCSAALRGTGSRAAAAAGVRPSAAGGAQQRRRWQLPRPRAAAAGCRRRQRHQQRLAPRLSGALRSEEGGGSGGAVALSRASQRPAATRLRQLRARPQRRHGCSGLPGRCSRGLAPLARIGSASSIPGRRR